MTKMKSPGKISRLHSPLLRYPESIRVCFMLTKSLGRGKNFPLDLGPESGPLDPAFFAARREDD